MAQSGCSQAATASSASPEGRFLASLAVEVCEDNASAALSTSAVVLTHSRSSSRKASLKRALARMLHSRRFRQIA